MLHPLHVNVQGNHGLHLHVFNQLCVNTLNPVDSLGICFQCQMKQLNCSYSRLDLWLCGWFMQVSNCLLMCATIRRVTLQLTLRCLSTHTALLSSERDHPPTLVLFYVSGEQTVAANKLQTAASLTGCAEGSSSESTASLTRAYLHTDYDSRSVKQQHF